MKREATIKHDDLETPSGVWLRLLQLAIAFGRVGLVGFGGGPSFIPLLQREVEAHRWLSREDFLDAFAFGNALPGPIATKLIGWVGYRVAGWPGAIIGLLAHILPTALAMVGLGALYFEFRDTDLVVGFLTGLRPVVIALLVMTIVGFAPSALGSWRRPHQSPIRLLIMAVAFGAAVAFAAPPALLIVAGAAAGLLLGPRS